MTYGPSLIFLPHVLLITVTAFLLSLISNVPLLMPVIVRPSAGKTRGKIQIKNTGELLLSRSSASASFRGAEGRALLRPACELRPTPGTGREQAPPLWLYLALVLA